MRTLTNCRAGSHSAAATAAAGRTVNCRSKDEINAEEDRGISIITDRRRPLQMTGTKATAKMMVDDNDDDTIARSRFSASAAARGPQTAAGLTSASYHHRNQHHHHRRPRCRRIIISVSLVASLSARLNETNSIAFSVSHLPADRNLALFLLTIW